jgi:uncharacterized membrane protein
MGISTEDALFVLTLCSALGCGLMGGLFFTFSTFVMKALGKLTPAAGIAAMQSINIVIINPLFLGLFLGTAVACVILAVFSLVIRGSVYVLAGSVLYLAGCIAVTAICNVPRNNALAAVDPGSAEGARLWADYLVSWTAWNHVRTISCLAAAGLLTVGVCRL